MEKRIDKATERALEAYPIVMSQHSDNCKEYDSNESDRLTFIEGYHQAEKDVKEELSNMFQEFMLDCIKDDTETHILHFVDVFNNKIKTIGNE